MVGWVLGRYLQVVSCTLSCNCKIIHTTAMRATHKKPTANQNRISSFTHFSSRVFELTHLMRARTLKSTVATPLENFSDKPRRLIVG